LNKYSRNAVVAEPPRRKVGTTHRSVSGVHLFRGETPVPYESTLERDFLIRLEADRSVLEVISQPLTLRYRHGGRECVYTPDYLVHHRQDGCVLRYGQHLPSELVEVKPRSELERNLPKWKPKYRAAVRYCLDQGYVFRLMHEGRVRDQAWANMRFLQRYRKMQVDEDLRDWIMGTARSMECFTFQELLDASCFSKYGPYGKAHGIAVIWHLIATEQLKCDLVEEPLGRETVLWVDFDGR